MVELYTYTVTDIDSGNVIWTFMLIKWRFFAGPIL